MKFIQTLYIQDNQKVLSNSFGWAAPEFHLMSWCLSFLQLKKYYGDIELYVNSPAVELLVGYLNLPYSIVHTTHDKLELIHPQLWAFPKLHTYSLQEKPFLHVDGDVFIFSKFSNDLLHGKLIVQNYEEATEYYTSTQRQLQKEFDYFPTCVKDDFESGLPIIAVNAGIMGGNDIYFFKEYTSLASDYINKNAHKLGHINVDSFNVFFEQHLFYALAKQKSISINVLFNDYIKDNKYKYLGNFHDVPCCRNYLHLLGHFKRDEYTCIKMAEKLRQLYPEYYYKIISIFKKNKMPFYTSVYNDFDIEKEDITKISTKKYNEPTYKAGEYETVFNQENKPTLLIIAEIELNNIIETNSDAGIVKRIIEDFLNFENCVYSFLRKNNNDNFLQIYGRDLEAVNWYCKIFSNKKNKGYLNQKVVACSEIKIYQSNFDWAGIINKYKRVGVLYYERLELAEGEFYNLLVPEIINDKFSIFDIDEVDVRILDLLKNPTSIKQLLNMIKLYFDYDIIDDSNEIYERYIVSIIEQLLVKKAIKPIK